MSSQDVIGDVLSGLADALRPLKDALESPEDFALFLGSLGYRSFVADKQQILGPFQAFADAYATVEGLVAEWQSMRGNRNNNPLELADLVERLSRAIISAVSAIIALQNTGEDPTAPEPFNQPEFWADFGGNVVDTLIHRYLEANHPTLFSVLTLLGILRDENITDSSPLGKSRIAYVRRETRWDLIGRVVTHPDQVPTEAYGWGTVFDHQLFVRNLALLAQMLGLTAAPTKLHPNLLVSYYGGSNASTADVQQLTVPLYWDVIDIGGVPAFVSFGLIVAPIPPDGLFSDPPEGFVFLPSSQGHLETKVSIAPNVDLSFGGGFDSEGAVKVEIRPRATRVIVDPKLGATVDAKAIVTVKPEHPIAIVGSQSSSRIEIAQVLLSVLARGANIDAEFVTEVSVNQGALIIDLSDSDGFLRTILGDRAHRVEFSIALRWSSRTGFSFAFSGEAGALEAVIPVHQNIGGVLFIDTVHLRLIAIPGNTGASLLADVTGGLRLGPIAASVEHMGVRVDLVTMQGGRTPGNLGSADFRFGFKPPDGVGLAIDSGVVVGGGYLFFDDQKQQYAGAVTLEVAELLSLSAFGLITTRMPDGSSGFSLLVLIATRFAPPIPLGYGFTLNGVGGLVGVNRTAAVEVLRSGLRAGTLGSVLFPVDPIRNAPQIVSDLAAVFPPAVERFLFGPMGILGWGTPTLWTLELALILELPQPVRLLLLGRLRVLLPEEHFAVVRLQLDSFGVIDFGNGDVALDAVLYDSVVAQYAVTGEMALRANFGKTPGFVLAVGGFHPGFTAPAGFPSLERVAISLATGDNPRLRLAAYLALTTNTVQFGALLDLFAKVDPFSIEGLFGFDAIVRIPPFGFVAELGAMVAVKFEGQVLMAAMLEVSLTGPTPWHAWGRANFKFLGADASVPFNVQIGEEAPPPLPAPVHVRPLVLAALNQPGNWATQLPRGDHPIVVLREQPKGTETLVHPLAALQVSQRVVPLRREITRFGNTVPERERWFTLEVDASTEAGSAVLDAVQEEVKEFFAPAQFWEMNDDEKLSAPAFVEEPAGIRFTVRGYTTCGPENQVSEENIGYEEAWEFIRAVTSSPQAVSGAAAESETPRESAPVTDAFVERVAARGAAGRAPFSHTGTARYRAAAEPSERGFGLKPLAYAIVAVDDGAVMADDLASLEELALFPARFPFSLGGGAIPAVALAAAPREERIAPLGYFDAVQAMRAYVAAHPEERGRVRVIPYHREVSS